jgi:prepilin-type N-terminal cleavage/methylation domain-containing protein
MPAGGNTGYSLLEMLVAMSIFSIVSVALTVSLTSGIRINHASERLTQATVLAHDTLEVLSARPAARESGSDTPQPGFTRTWTVTPDVPQPGVTQLDVTIAWTDQHPRTITLSTVLND